MVVGRSMTLKLALAAGAAFLLSADSLKVERAAAAAAPTCRLALMTDGSALDVHRKSTASHDSVDEQAVFTVILIFFHGTLAMLNLGLQSPRLH